jgi:hypothetical protein
MFTTKVIPLVDRMLEDEIVKVIRSLNNDPVGSQDYMKTVEALTKLHALRSKNPSTVSKETLAIVAGNLLGIFMIIKHEHLNVITSRAMQLVIKPR